MAKPLSDAELEAIKQRRWDEIRQADREREWDRKDPPRWYDGLVIGGMGWLAVIGLPICIIGIIVGIWGAFR